MWHILVNMNKSFLFRRNVFSQKGSTLTVWMVAVWVRGCEMDDGNGIVYNSDQQKIYVQEACILVMDRYGV